MSRHEDIIALLHMLEHAREACEIVRGKRRRDLDRDRKLNLALVRLLEVVGEAASRVSPGARARYSSIPWPEIVMPFLQQKQAPICHSCASRNPGALTPILSPLAGESWSEGDLLWHSSQ